MQKSTNLTLKPYLKIGQYTFRQSCTIITPVFMESYGAGYRNVTVYAKKARGMMLRFIIQNRINTPEYLKAFDEKGYCLNNNLSTRNEWVFCR